MTKRSELPVVRVLRRGVNVRFVCSGCGGSAFGSYTVNGVREDWDKGLIKRHCNGCPAPHFPIAEDYAHFTVDGKKYPSQAEFEAAVYTTSDAPDAAVGVTRGQVIMWGPKSRGKSWQK